MGTPELFAFTVIIMKVYGIDWWISEAKFKTFLNFCVTIPSIKLQTIRSINTLTF